MNEILANPFSLEGKTILVTGASSGIGRAIAIACAHMGASVILNARNVEKLNATLNEMFNREHHVLKPAELTDELKLRAMVDSLPKLDGVVHCAGVGSRVFCKSIGKDDINHVFQPNIEAPMLLQSELLKKKKINKGASIVFIASRAAQAPSYGNAIYSASKGAILSYAKCLGLELAPRKIRVNCISPAMVWTNLILKDGISKEDLEEAQSKYPLKRFGKPEDVAYLAVYMLSDASEWMTGSSVDITGGGEGTLTL